MATRKPLPLLSDSGATRIGFVNLGCSKNQVDAEVMLGSLAAKGFALTADPAEARNYLARVMAKAAEGPVQGALCLRSTGEYIGEAGAYNHHPLHLRINLGYNLLLQGKNEEAAAEFRRALVLRPDSQTARNNLGLAMAARPEESTPVEVGARRP